MQLIFGHLWLAIAFPLLAVQPSAAEVVDRIARSSAERNLEEIPQLSEIESPLTSAAWLLVQSSNSEITQVTNVRLDSTTTGIAVILTTADGTALKPTSKSADNSLIADIPNAVLALPKGEAFRANNPVPGITSVTVTQLDANSIRVSVTGETAVPTAEIVPATSGLVLSVTPAVAQAAEAEIDVVVTATRTEEAVENVPRSVTVVDREQIQQQATLSPGRNLQDILGNVVPGFGPPNQNNNLFGQSLRGRRPQVLIDGVPIKSNLSTVQARDLRTIDPAAVERVEVVRGPSAIYGDGGTGGVINIITRQPSEERLTSRSEIAVDTSLTNSEDSFGNYLEHSISGREGNVDFLTTFSRKDTGSFFDAAGDRIPTSALADTETLNFLGKVGIDFGEQQRLQLTVNHYDDRENSNFIVDPITDEIPGIQKARALERPDPEYIDYSNPKNLNTVFNLGYTHENLWGSQVELQAYYRDNLYRAQGFDFRPLGNTNPGISGQENEKEQWGARLQIETPLAETLSLLWGADYSDEDASIFVFGFDEQDFDNSGGRIFRQVEEFTFAPPYNFSNLGLFAQLQWDASDRWAVSGGLRYERFGLSVDDYTVLTFTEEPGQDVTGGEINFDDTLFNIGVVYSVTEEIGLFANFAQGFSAPDFGRLLRNPPEGFTSVEEDLDVTRPQRVDNYELGVRGSWSNVQASLAGFYNESDLGVIFTPSQDLANLAIVSRQPQRIYGLEATVDWQPGRGWGLGSSISWAEGEFEEEGEYLALDSSIIQPLKLTAYVQHETAFGWLNRLQALYIGDRDRSFNDEVDPVPIDSYITVDFISSIPLFSGRLAFSIENLFNEQYFPVTSQYLGGFNDIENFAGRGRTLRVGYSIEW